MSKYRVKSGIHAFGDKIYRTGDIFELESDKFIETSGRPDLFELAEPPPVIVSDDDDDGDSGDDEARVVSTGREPPAPEVVIPIVPASALVPPAPAKRGRKPKQAPAKE